MYLINKYTLWYNNIISKAINRNLRTRQEAKKVLGYCERHHITPRSLGGDNTKANLVYLTYQEHFICHWLLFKMTVGKNKSKMANAWYRMCQKNKFQERQSSRNYSLARKAFSENNPFKDKDVVKIVRERMINDNPMKRPEVVDKVRSSLKGKMAGDKNPFYMKNHTEKTLEKLSGNNHYSKKPGYVFPAEQAVQKRLETIAKNNKPRKLLLVTCPHCGVEGKGGNMTRYHFTKCTTLKN